MTIRSRRLLEAPAERTTDALWAFGAGSATCVLAAGPLPGNDPQVATLVVVTPYAAGTIVLGAPRILAALESSAWWRAASAAGTAALLILAISIDQGWTPVAAVLAAFSVSVLAAARQPGGRADLRWRLTALVLGSLSGMLLVQAGGPRVALPALVVMAALADAVLRHRAGAPEQVPARIRLTLSLFAASPLLRRRAWDVVVASVATGTAVGFIGHNDSGLQNSEWVALGCTVFFAGVAAGIAAPFLTPAGPRLADAYRAAQICLCLGGLLLVSRLAFPGAPPAVVWLGLLLVPAGAAAQAVILVTEFRATLGQLFRVAERTWLTVCCGAVCLTAVVLSLVGARTFVLATLLVAAVCWQSLGALRQRPMSTSGQD